ncbi:IS3 family transposase [Streptosporangium sp. NPDC000396]|uniref:IS3 family transposase n=1 Tax=Streptosporangium sp. NPDC000396 TaxID=3366185 RepID=UPI0036B3610A
MDAPPRASSTSQPNTRPTSKYRRRNSTSAEPRRPGQPPCPVLASHRQERLDEVIVASFQASAGTYGSPRITRDMHQQGWRISVNTVAARMAELGLVVRRRREPRWLTRAGKRQAAPDLVYRQFTAARTASRAKAQQATASATSYMNTPRSHEETRYSAPPPCGTGI